MVRECARCAHCGAAIDPAEWHPVAAPEAVPGVYAFCTPSCRAAWLDRNR